MLAEHRNNPACNDCHQKIDPWGLTLEHFDAIGKFHPKDHRNQPITIDVSLPGGTSVDGITALQKALVNEKSEFFAKALVENLLIYALGRELEFTDAETVEKLTEHFIDEGYRLKLLIVRIVTDEAFRIK